jgi:glycosidase
MRYCICLLPYLLALLPLLLAAPLSAQPNALEHIEPPCWWVGMNNPNVQILIHSKDIAKAESIVIQYPGVKITGITKVENPNYVFVNLNISKTAKPGQMLLRVKKDGMEVISGYNLLPRSANKQRAQGFTSSDLVYVLMPDRFANGDPKNDTVAGMPDITHRDSLNARHGGDIQGIINHLDYISNLGCTAVWATPLLENNQERFSYHGYGITNFYKIDARFGSNDLYKAYVDSAHKRGLKVIKDMVLNHCGDKAYLFQDPPTQDWFNDYAAYKGSPNWKTQVRKSNFRASTVSDPYASQFDRETMTNRWFDWMLPDLNQQQPLLATYLIQNTIWWIEFAGIDGIRMDTYPYPNKEFSSRWVKTVLAEYPKLGIVGEVWISESVGMTAYWLAGTKNRDGFLPALPTTTDFPMMGAISAAVNEQEGWNEGMARVYNTLAQDFLYPNPQSNLIFLDNHDLGRVFSNVGEDMSKFKIALTLLLTLRGVPQIYYGTEIATPGIKDTDPNVRKDFPGGWAEDKRSAFTEQGRTEREQAAFTHLRTLAQWRKTKAVIHTGKLMQFVPHDGVYTYFRYNDNETVMVTINNTTQEKQVNTERYAERTKGFSAATNVLTGTTLTNLATLTIPPKTALVLELKK